MKSIQSLLNDSGPDDLTIHRIVGVERFLQMLHEDSLTLMAPQKWDDPYEESLQKHYERHGSTLGEFKVYGLCWSTESRSDALWRIYSPGKLGIKVSTSVATLAGALSSTSTEESLLSNTFLGRVAYLPERTSKKTEFQWPNGALRLSKNNFVESISTFSNAIDEIIGFSPAGDLAIDAPLLARAFLVKRRAFKHEEEVRLLCFPSRAIREKVQPKRDADNKVIKLKCPMSQLVTQVEFDPRMGDDVVDALTHFISPKLTQLNVKGQIKKSSLYTIPSSKAFKSNVN